jgi:REP element-mobilizing transposase RayT
LALYNKGRARVSDPAAARSENVALPAIAMHGPAQEGRARVSDPAAARSENVALPEAAARSENVALPEAAARSENVALPVIAQVLLDSLLFYETLGKWHLWTVIVMPDHIHFIATFNLEIGIKPSVVAWKRYHTSTTGVAFQRDYFEHRLRSDDEFVEKAEYIRQNPVRRGLTEHPEAWPYLWLR